MVSKKKKKIQEMIIVSSIVVIFMLISVIAGSILEVKRSFLLGVESGIIFSFLIYFIYSIIQIKKIKYTDEREERNLLKAQSVAYSVSIILAAVLSFLDFSNKVNITLEIHEVCTLFICISFSVFILAYFILNKKC